MPLPIILKRLAFKILPKEWFFWIIEDRGTVSNNWLQENDRKNND
jgi:hypothetical protein